MVRLPQADDLGGLPSFESGRPIADLDIAGPLTRGGQALAQGIQSVANDLADVAAIKARKQAQDDEMGLARAKSDYLTKKIGLDGAFENDTRYGNGLTDDYTKRLTTIGDEAGKSLTSPRAKETYGLWRQQHDAEGTVSIRSKAWGNEKDALVADANTRREGLRQAALKSASEVERAQAITTARDLLDNVAERGFISKTEAQAKHIAWVQSYAKDAAATLPAAERVRVLGKGDKAMSLLREFEDFRDAPYWDVNAHRVGYGSDTVTRADGTVSRVTETSRVSRDDAERDLARRVRQTQRGIVQTVGPESWDKLNDDQRAALTSIAYNYGSLPAGVATAVKSGDAEKVVQAVEGLKPHNDGVNANRRQREADIIRGGGQIGADKPSNDGTVYDFLDEADRVTMLRQAESEIEADEKAREVEARQAETALRQDTKGRYDLAIEQDQVSRDQILAEPNMDAGDKAVLLRRWDDRNKDSLSAANVWRSIQAGEPLDPDESKRGLNKLFDEAGGMPALVNSNAKAVATVSYFWNKAQVLPGNAKLALTGMVRSPDQGKAISGLAILDSLQRQNPVAFRAAFDENVEKSLTYYQDRLGYSSDKDIFDGVRALSDPQTIKAREPLVKAGMDKAVKEYDAAKVAGLFDQSILPFTEPNAPERVQDAVMLQQDFQRLYADAYAEDPANAEKNALALLQRKWGVSGVNSGGIMRYPPESYYPKVNGSQDWMTEQLETDLRTLGYTVEQSKWVTAPAARNRGRPGWAEKPEPVRNYVLQALPVTESDIASGQPPHYAVLVANPKTGEWEAVLDKDGGMLAYQWDVTGPREKARGEMRRENATRRSFMDALEAGGTSGVGMPEGLGVP